MLSIGELSQAAQVSVKTIRYYQELGILYPVKTDEITGYRYYDSSSYDRVNAILTLKELGFTLKEIKNILEECSEDRELKDFIISKITDIKNKVRKLKNTEKQLSLFASQLQNAPENSEVGIHEINLDIPYLATVKVEGYYDQIGEGFKILYKKLGRFIKGAPYALFNDLEYKEEGANFSAGVELKKEMKIQGVKNLEFKEVKAVKTVYKGPYGGQGSAYLKLFEYCRKNSINVKPPIVEHYIKGPGFIFKGNPMNYITECILIIDE